MDSNEQKKDLLIEELRAKIEELDASSRADLDWEFRSLLQSLSHAVMYIDAGGKALLMNSAAIKMIGAPQEALMQTSMFDVPWICRNEDGSEMPFENHPVALALKQGQVVKNQVVGIVVPESGLCKWFTISAVPRFESGSQTATEAFVIFEDITTRKTIETALLKSEEHYRLITENMTESVWVLGLDLRMKYISPSAIRVRGFSLMELKEMSLEKQMTPASYALVSGYLARELTPQNIANKEHAFSGTLEIEVYKKDGSTYWSELRVSIVHDNEGWPTGILGVGRDITERKTAEESEKQHLQTIEFLSRAGMALVDLPLDKNIYALIGEQFSALIPSNAILAISELDETTGVYKGRTVLGVDKIMGMIKTIIGKNPMEIADDFGPVAKKLIVQGKLRKVEEGLKDFAHIFPASVARGIEKLLGISAFYVIGIIRENKILAGVTILLRGDSGAPDTAAIEAYANMAAIALAKRKAESALAESQERFKRIADTLTDYIYTVRFENGKAAETIHGPGCHMVTGYTNEDFQKNLLLWITMVHPDDRQLVRDFFNKALDKPIVNPIQHRIIRKDGIERWVRNTPVFHFNEKGVLLSYDGLVQDITENKLAERAVFLAKERYRQLFNSISDAVSLAEFPDGDTPGKFVDVNEAHCRLLEYSREELLSHTPMTDSITMDISLSAGITHTLRKDKHALFESTLLSKNGRKVPVEINAHVIDLEGKPYLLSIVRDITKRKTNEALLRESERRFREMFETSVDGIVTTDLDGRIVDCNQAFLSLLDYSTVKEVVSLSFCDLTPPEYHDLDNAMLLEARGNGHSPVYEKEYLRKNGERFPVNIRRWLRLDIADKPVGLWSIVRDITEKKKTDAELLKSQHLQSLSLLSGGIAHDFNNLLGGIFGYIDIAREFADSPAKTNEYLDKALKSLDRAKDLSQRLLTFSKGGTPSKKLTNLADLVKDSVALSLSGKNVRAKISIARDLASCDVDASQIGRVINNVVTNAVQAMPDGGTVSVVAKNLRVSQKSGLPLKDGPYVRISIQDTGTGIPDTLLCKVFDPFFTTKPKGTGLGLSICQSIISKHDGHIAIASTAGKGAEVILYLPASREKAAVQGKKSTAPLHGHGKILVMDDEDFVLDIATQMLTKMGYSAVTAQHGDEALAKYVKAMDNGAPFDAVMLDLTIPGGMGGAKTCERLLKINPAVKVIASSGYSNDPVMASPQKYGFKTVLKKPYVTEELSEVLLRLLKERI
jgi:PAS domain S-box-containing protein